MKNKKILIPIILAVVLFLFMMMGVAGTGILTVVACYSVEPVFDEKTYELGDVVISEDVEDYLRGPELVLKLARLNLEEVNSDAVGDYVVSCRVLIRKCEYAIHVVDTTSPTLTFGESETVFGTYNPYSSDRFVEIADAKDLSALNEIELVSCTDENGETIVIQNEELYFETSGTYTFEFEVSDIYGNSTIDSTCIEIVDAPHFALLEDREYQVGSSYDLMDYVYAYDRFDNDLTEDIVIVSDDNFNIAVAGDYEVTYSIVDSDDIVRTETVVISVGDYEENDFGFENTPENLQVLVEHDYFKYQPFENNADPNAVIDLTQYSSFSIKADTGAFASGFIYKITPNYVYFMTNRHCKAIYNCSSFGMYDYDDSSTTIYMKYCEKYVCQSDDIAVIKIPVTTFELNDLLTYKEVYIDWDIYEDMEVGDILIENTQCFGTISKEPYYDKADTGVITNYDIFCDTSYGKYWLTVSEKINIAGQSGSPAFNTDGYFIGMVFGHIRWAERSNWISSYVSLKYIKQFVDTIEFE